MTCSQRHPQRIGTLVCALALLLALPVSAAEGFTFGFDVGRGWFSVDRDRLERAGADGSDFASTFDRRASPLVDLHLGWNVRGHALLEGVLGGTGWDPFTRGMRGGAGFGGLRGTWFPAQLFEQVRDRNWDAGLELGSGYSVAGAARYAMAGPYLQLGLTAEYRPLSWLGLGAFYRHNFAFWNRFIHDFDNNVVTTVSGNRAGWGMLGLSLNVHFVPAAP